MTVAPRLTFFAGKGGVGKTTCAAAAAFASAGRGADVLVVSTDPAHSLGDALDVSIGPRPRRVTARRGRLTAVEIDAPSAFRRFLGRRRESLMAVVERGTYLDREDVERFARLSLPGVDELIALMEVARLARAGGHDEVVVDTAPTGHTLRLLAMPALLARVAELLDGLQDKHRFLARSLAGAYRPDASDALVSELEREASSLAGQLRDAARSRFVWVTLPEELAVAETADGVAALRAAGMPLSAIAVNRVTPPPPRPCALCDGRRRAEAEALAVLVRAHPATPVHLIPALDAEPRGGKALAAVAKGLETAVRPRTAPRRVPKPRRAPETRSYDAPWLADVLPAEPRLVLFAGKGGVGKTTCAATTALAAASRSRGRWLLLSADPAHSVADVLARAVGDDPRRIAPALEAREIDAPRALEERRRRYRDAVGTLLAAGGGRRGVDATYDRRAVEDLLELAPPGIDELFAVLSVVDAVLPEKGPARYDAVVVDAAPTGHALRLLAMPDLALEWVQALLAVLLKYREVVKLGALAEELVALSRSLRHLHTLLRDPKRSAIVVVTRPAELPRRETERLLRRLAAEKLPVSAVIVNAVTPPGCPRCRRAAARERAQVRVLRRKVARSKPLLEAPAVAPPPVGAPALSRWGETWSRIETEG